MHYMITVKRKWEHHETVPCEGQWLYQAVKGDYYCADWMTYSEYWHWKNTIIIEDWKNNA